MVKQPSISYLLYLFWLGHAIIKEKHVNFKILFTYTSHKKNFHLSKLTITGYKFTLPLAAE